MRIPNSQPADDDQPDHEERVRSAPTVSSLTATPPGGQETVSTADGPAPAASQSNVPLPIIPGYTVVRLLGRGGMGEVYEVINRLGRHFALKMIRADRCDDTLRERFRQEAGTLLDVDHAHVARIFEYNEADNTPYFTMRLLTGGALSSRLAEFAGDTHKTVALMQVVAEAVGYLHRRGLLHRDLKPGNVLFDEQGEPYVSDFGLVKDRDVLEQVQPISSPDSAKVSELTTAGQLLGTLRYMAPEQIAGQLDRVGPWSDVWALGVMLYELLTGQRPFEGNDVTSLRSSLARGQPPAPHQLNPKLEPPLEKIVLKCLAMQPEDRYASADQLAKSLRDFLAAEKQKQIRVCQQRIAASLAVPLVLLAVVAVPITRHFVDPDKDLHVAQRRLQSGQKVELVGNNGMPIFFRPRVSPEGNVWLDKNGVMTVTTQKLALIELMPDSKRDRYRFRMSVRQNTTTSRASRAGIYCLHRVVEHKQSQHHCFAELSVREEDEDEQQIWKFEKPGPARAVTSMAFWLRTAGDDPIYNTNHHCGYHPFETDVPAEGAPWRDLVFEVTPDEVVARHQDKVIGRVRMPVARRRIDSLLKNWNLPPLPAPLGPRDGLGVYVLGSSASFRLGAIEPLPDPPQ